MTTLQEWWDGGVADVPSIVLGFGVLIHSLATELEAAYEFSGVCGIIDPTTAMVSEKGDVFLEVVGMRSVFQALRTQDHRFRYLYGEECWALSRILWPHDGTFAPATGWGHVADLHRAVCSDTIEDFVRTVWKDSTLVLQEDFPLWDATNRAETVDQLRVPPEKAYACLLETVQLEEVRSIPLKDPATDAAIKRIFSPVDPDKVDVFPMGALLLITLSRFRATFLSRSPPASLWSTGRALLKSLVLLCYRMTHVLPEERPAPADVLEDLRGCWTEFVDQVKLDGPDGGVELAGEEEPGTAATSDDEYGST